MSKDKLLEGQLAQIGLMGSIDDALQRAEKQLISFVDTDSNKDKFARLLSIYKSIVFDYGKATHVYHEIYGDSL